MYIILSTWALQSLFLTSCRCRCRRCVSFFFLLLCFCFFLSLSCAVFSSMVLRVFFLFFSMLFCWFWVESAGAALLELSFDSWLLCCVENIAHLQRLWALKSRYTDRMADSINLKIDMDATWKKSRILQKTLKRDSVSVKLHRFVQKKPSVRFKFFSFNLFSTVITWKFFAYNIGIYPKKKIKIAKYQKYSFDIYSLRAEQAKKKLNVDIERKREIHKDREGNRKKNRNKKRETLI